MAYIRFVENCALVMFVFATVVSPAAFAKMCTNDEYPDDNGKCRHCKRLCDASYATRSQCNDACPDYAKRLSAASFTTVVTPSSSSHQKLTESSQTAASDQLTAAVARLVSSEEGTMLLQQHPTVRLLLFAGLPVVLVFLLAAVGLCLRQYWRGRVPKNSRQNSDIEIGTLNSKIAQPSDAQQHRIFNQETNYPPGQQMCSPTPTMPYVFQILDRERQQIDVVVR